MDKKLLELEGDLVKNIKIKEVSEEKLNINRKSFKDPWVSNIDLVAPDKEKIQNVLDRLSSLSFSKLLERQVISDNESNTLEKSLVVT